MEKIPGCWEHMSMVWNELKSTKPEHGNLAAVWLDIANAYGFVPHQLIFFALQRYGVPEHWIKLIRNYYKGLWSISQSASAPSSWHHHLRGIFIGCTAASIILFLSAINVVIEYICNCYLNSLNFRAEPLCEQMVARNYYFFAHFTARKLNVREIFLLKRSVKIRLRETGKRVKNIFLP